MKKLLAILALSVSTFSSANVFDELKTMPATQYQIGKAQLNIYSVFVSQELRGEKLDGSKFRFSGFMPYENEGQLGFKISLEGKSKYLTDNQCQSISKRLSSQFSATGLTKAIWSELPKAKQDAIAAEFKVITELVDSNNKSLKIEC